MTAVLSRPVLHEIPVGWIGSPRLFRGLDLLQYQAHLAEHGPLPTYSRDALLASLDAVALTGRGGAGFPMARKIRSLRKGEPVVVVNGAEGEPVSAKDHALLSRAPHLVLDGAAAVAVAIGAQRVLVAISDPSLAVPLHQALATRPDSGVFELHQVPDRFVAGEARALVSALNGRAAVPPGRRILPTDTGVHGQPTLLANAESLAQLAVLVRLGAASFASIGTAAEPGSTLLTVTGAVESPGVIEVPLGASLGSVATAVGALPSQTVVIGGYHGGWLRARPELELSRAGLTAAGGTLGAGVLIFIGEHTCPLGELARVAGWLAEESAKQCGPCSSAYLHWLLTFGPWPPDRRRRLSGTWTCWPDGEPVRIRMARCASSPARWPCLGPNCRRTARTAVAAGSIVASWRPRVRSERCDGRAFE
jgi:NADH:ubiquinone oxidoreductase subunit F (NADH-binding)